MLERYNTVKIYHFMTMKTYKAKGKDLTNKDMRSVFDELYQIDQMIKNDMYVGRQTYITIRLVTIIEQFFREIIEFLLRKYPDKRPKTVELDTRLVASIVKTTSHAKKIFMTERIISQAFSFQNTIDINESMQKYGKIQIFQNNLDVMTKSGNSNGLLKREYDKFFDARHSVVHSIEQRPYLNVKKYYNMAEKLFDYTLEKNRLLWFL